MIMSKKGVFLLSAGLLLWGCATQQGVVVEGKEYGVTKGAFGGRWWNYYERGCSYLAGNLNSEAEADLKKAVSMRSQDSWQARTYGLHFVEYFPNRELGVAYFQMGRLEDAERCLRTSLEQIDTDRTHHYLDQVTRRKIAQGTIQDTSEPAVSTSVEEKTLISSRELAIEIKASDDVGVASVEVNGEPLPQRGSAEEVSFKDEILLKEGTHEIEVAANDLADKQVKKKVEVTVDLTGPTIGIFAPADPTVTENVSAMLEGVTLDKNGVVSVALSERILAESSGEARLEFGTELPLGSGENSFILIAKDTAGNETRSSVKVFRGRPDSTAAKLWLLQQKAPHLLAYAANGFPNITMGLDACLAQAEAEAASSPVLIKLKSPDPEKPYRHNRTLRVSGDVVSQTKVASLQINGEPVGELTGAPKESFNKRIPIDVDEATAKTTVSIAAADDQGHQAEQKFEVEIRPVMLNSRESKMPVAVLAFGGSGVDQDVGNMLRITTETQLFDAGRFRVLDRVELQAVLTEQQLAAALADPLQAIQLGKVANAQVLLVAEVFPRDQKGLEIKARAISAETSDLLKLLDVFVEDKGNTELVSQRCKTLATQLEQAFPRLSGEVLSVKAQAGGDLLLLNWTKEDGLIEGMYLLVVQEGEPFVDATTGEVLQPGGIEEVGKARIEGFMTNGCKAKVTNVQTEGAKVAQGMAAITM
jgi:tetratricopeptide (TPR) repeat protein